MLPFLCKPAQLPGFSLLAGASPWNCRQGSISKQAAKNLPGNVLGSKTTNAYVQGSILPHHINIAGATGLGAAF